MRDAGQIVHRNWYDSPHFPQEDSIKVQSVAIVALAVVKVINSVVCMGNKDVANLATSNSHILGFPFQQFTDLFSGVDFFLNCMGLG